MSKLERKWWFSGLCAVVAALGAFLLFQAAGYSLPFGVDGTLAQYLVFILCVLCLQRLVSLTLWLLVLLFAPSVARGEA
jgi:uncharacterized membrane protein